MCNAETPLRKGKMGKDEAQENFKIYRNRTWTDQTKDT